MLREEEAVDSCIRSNPHLPLHKGEGKFFMLCTAPVSRKSHYRRKLVDRMKTIAESGLHQHLDIMKGLTTLTHTALFVEELRFQSLRFADVEIVFAILAIGYTFAFFVHFYFKSCSAILRI